MAHLYVPPDCLWCKLRFAVSGKTEEVNMTFGVRWQIQGNTQTWQQNVVAVSSAWTGAFPKNTMATALTFLGVTGYLGNYDEEYEYLYQYDVSPAWTGTGTWGSVPLQCAPIVKKLSAKIGKKHRGRMYMPAPMLSENSVAGDGTINATLRNDWNGYWGTFMSSLAAVPLEPVLFHNSTGVQSVDEPTVITSLVMEPIIGTQRRRLR